MQQPHIVIVGGGFAGIEAIRTLLRRKVSATITLVSKKENFDYYPALYRLVTGALAIEVSVPLRDIFDSGIVQIVEDTFVSVDSEKKTITLASDTVLSFDYLVLALGSETNYFGIAGVQEHSFSFKSVEEALRLKTHLIQCISGSIGLPKEEAVKRLHVVIVGGGPSGVELAGDLMDFMHTVAGKCAVPKNLVTVDLIESAPRILAALPEKASAKAARRLRSRGVNIFTNRTLTGQDIGSAALNDMTMQTQTVIWTAGTKIVDEFSKLPHATLSEKKRVVVDSMLRLPDQRSIFVVGDGAATLRSGLAQTAIYDGAYVGDQIARMILSEQPSPYTPPTVSFVIPIGNYWALFVHNNRVFSGFLPWLLRNAIDFRYFSSILPLWYVFDVYRRGHKYRNLQKAIKTCAM